jgi:hypothetical protein
MLRYRLAKEWPLVVAGLSAALLVLLVWRHYSTQLASPTVHEVATVIRFGQASFEKGDFPTVFVRRADGRVQQLGGRKRLIAECKQGGPIRLIQTGAMVRLNVPAC